MKKLAISISAILIASMLAFTGCVAGNNEASNLSDNNQNNISNDILYDGRFIAFNMNDFIEFATSKGEKTINEVDYKNFDANKSFIEWTEQTDNILVPILPNSWYWRMTEVMKDGTYIVSYSNREDNYGWNEEYISVHMYLTPMEDSDNSFNQEKIYSMITKDGIAEGTIIETGECAYGQCYYVNIPNYYPEIVFVNSGYLIQVIVLEGKEESKPWKPEYFNFINFELIPINGSQ